MLGPTPFGASAPLVEERVTGTAALDRVDSLYFLGGVMTLINDF